MARIAGERSYPRELSRHHLIWNWIWGIAGAPLAVPLTAALIIMCEYFKSTEKIAEILSRDA